MEEYPSPVSYTHLDVYKRQINEDEDREMTSTSSMSFSDDGIAYCYADKNDDVTMQDVYKRQIKRFIKRR